MSNHDRLDPALHPIDGRRFSDPVAERTDWKPAHRGGANFRTHRMVQVEGRRIEFRPSRWSRLPNTIALLWGGGLLLALLADMTVAGDYTLIAGDGWAIAFASVCILVGWRSNFFRVEPAIFDLQSGLCWRGKRRPREPLSPQDQTRTARIPDIHALQLIGEVDMTAYLDLSPDGRRLLCTHLDGVVRLWEREEGRIVLSVMGTAEATTTLGHRTGTEPSPQARSDASSTASRGWDRRMGDFDVSPRGRLAKRSTTVR